MLAHVNCPYCKNNQYDIWGMERGYCVARCASCDFLYLNPRPDQKTIDSAVRSGVHKAAGGLDVRSRYLPKRTKLYQSVLSGMFQDIWSRGHAIRWIDVGCGYGEVIEAVQSLAPNGSSIHGIEPMEVKAAEAKSRGLSVTHGYLNPSDHFADFISVVDVFSHLPDFDAFLDDIRKTLSKGGGLFLETGNLADVERRNDFPGELGLPDHLCFGGEKHIVEFLRRNGFEVRNIRKVRVDDLAWTTKNIAKRILGRPALVSFPYKSAYRSLQIRAEAI